MLYWPLKLLSWPVIVFVCPEVSGHMPLWDEEWCQLQPGSLPDLAMQSAYPVALSFILGRYAELYLIAFRQSVARDRVDIPIPTHGFHSVSFTQFSSGLLSEKNIYCLSWLMWYLTCLYLEISDIIGAIERSVNTETESRTFNTLLGEFLMACNELYLSYRFFFFCDWDILAFLLSKK